MRNEKRKEEKAEKIRKGLGEERYEGEREVKRALRASRRAWAVEQEKVWEDAEEEGSEESEESGEEEDEDEEEGEEEEEEGRPSPCSGLEVWTWKGGFWG